MTGAAPASRLDCAILFEPRSGEPERVIAGVCDLGGHPVVLDNSETPEARGRVAAAAAAAGVEVLGNGINLGTGAGLNMLIRRAQALELPWLHYLDQDSVPTPGYLDALSELAEVPADVALVGARYAEPGELAHAGTGALIPVRFVIASGTAMRTAAMVEVDGCDERMFLDVVDHEICLRVRAAGYRIVVDPRRVLSHPIGADAAEVGRVLVTRHPTWRRRMMWRNSAFLVAGYAPHFPRDCAVHLLARLVETVSGAVRFRRVDFLTSAVAGLLSALVRPARRRGLSASEGGR